jgi:Protein kinase domain/AAA ATPase domain
VNPARGAATRSKRQSASRYELGEPFATGGMGVIRRGLDRWAGREIAHKRLRVDREERRPRISALFQREYDTLARLKHPNIVEVYDFGFDEQGAYYVMEWLSGDDLSKLAPLPVREACSVLRDVASALALVHTRRLVHRDVSPNNVRLTRSGVAKLIDFGTLTSFGRANEIAGTPAFIAPECLVDEPLDARTDIYALGALAYWTLSGRVAVRAQSIAELQDAFELPVVPISQQVPDLPERLGELIHAMLSHDRAQRPAHAGDVIERLTEIGGLPSERDERKVAYSYLKHPPLVGRDDALGELERALDAALHGRGGVVSLEGGVGLGRTALLDQLAIDAQLKAATVLRAEGGAEAGAHGVARRLIQLGVRIYPDLEGSETYRRRQLDASEGAVHPVEALERSALAAARLRKLLLALSERSPLVIAIDNADLADEESLSLLASMTQEFAQQPILLALGTGRVQDASSAPLHRLLVGARRVTLKNLEEDEVIALLSGMFGDVPNTRRSASWLHAETGGNPAQCVDLLRLLIQQDAIRYQRGVFSLPHDIDIDMVHERRAHALLTRVAGLSADAQAVVELLSLHYGLLGVDQICDAGSLTPREVSLAVEQLVHRGVVFAPADAVGLRGESLRAVIEASVGPERAQALHLALARAIEFLPDDPLVSELDVVFHLFRSGPASEPEAAARIMKLLQLRGHDVSFYAPSVPLLEATLAYYQRKHDSEAECAQLLGALSVTGWYGNLEAQRKYLRPALDALAKQCGFGVARKLMPYLGIYLALLAGLTYALLCAPFFPRRFGRFNIRRRVSDFFAVAAVGIATATANCDDETADEIIDRIEPTRGFPASTVPGYGRLFCTATRELLSLHTLEASRQYERVRKGISRKRWLLEERLRHQQLLGCFHGLAHAHMDRADGVTMAMAEAMERGSPFFAPHAETLRVVHYAIRGDHDKAERHRARAEALAYRGGVSWTAASVLAVRLIEPAFAAGDLTTIMRCQAELERLSRWAPSLGRFLVAARARLAMLRGQAEQAAEMLEPVLSDSPTFRFLRTAYAEALCELGAFERAREQAVRVLDGVSAEQRAFSSVFRLPFVALARAELGLGNPDAARCVLLERLELAEPQNNPLELGVLQRELASIALAVRDAVAFDRHLSLMTAHFRATQHPHIARQRELLLTRAISAGLKESPTGAFLPGGSDGALESATVIEARNSRTSLPRRTS